MEKDYAYEIEKATKIRFKEVKKQKEDVSLETKKNLLKLLNNFKNTKKLEYIYKFRYAILNRDIAKPELSEIYEKLFKKMLNSNENSVIFTEWNNIFSTIFGNIPVINDNVGIKYIDKIVTMFCNTKNESKLRVLMLLFVSLYHIDNKDKKYIDLLLEEINKTEESYILDSYQTIIKNIYKINENDLLFNHREFILYQFSESISKSNSEYLSELLNIFLTEEDNIKNIYLINLFKIFSSTENRELRNAYYELMNNKIFIESDKNIQNRCLIILKHIPSSEYLKMRLVTRIILEIIVVIESKYIQDYLLEKVSRIKNTDSLELLLHLTPILNDFSTEDEYVRVIDSLEDKSNNLTKKLVINLDYNE